MDSAIRLKIQNPKNEANIISRLFFLWIVKFFRQIFKHDIQIEDLFKVLTEDSSEQLTDKLEVNWQTEILNAKIQNRKPKLLSALMRTFFWSYMYYGFILFVQHVIFRTAQPLLLAQIISLFEKDVYDQNSLYLSVALLVGVTALIVFTMHHINFGQLSIGMRIRIALSALMYRKTLRLSKAALNETSVGQIVNLLSNDVTRFDLVTMALHYLWILPFQAVLIAYLCWTKIGVSSMVGVASIAILSLPIQGYLGKLTSILRLRVADKTDSRVTLMSEIIAGVQVIKMYAWEQPFENLVRSSRSDEVKALTVTSYLRGIYQSFIIFVERVALFLTLTVYVYCGNMFVAEQVFCISQFFNLLQLTMSIFYPLSISYGSETLVSIDRIERFLLMEENEKTTVEFEADSGAAVERVFASWTGNPFLTDITFNVPKGSLCAIVGPVGSGKSSILNLLLNELTPRQGSIKIQGSISFASQEPWLFASTIRNNILFGNEYNRKLYNTVVKVCALQKDFDQFLLGDKTLVGERGSVLSGGQRARVNLARAVYREADVYLFDDPLSAVDVHVAKHLFEQCIVKYLRRKTRILVTHRLQYLKKADMIIVVNNGRIEAQGTYNDLCQRNSFFAKETLEQEKDLLEKQDDHRASLSLSDSFMLDSVDCRSELGEEEERGIKSGSESLCDYIKASDSPILIIFVGFAFILCQALCSCADYWVTFWTQQENLKNTSQQNSYTKKSFLDTNLAIYVYLTLIISLVAVTFMRSFAYFKLAMNTSKNLHNKMFKSLLEAPLRFFNTNPAGRVLNRFSKDMGAIDEILPRILMEATQITFVMSGILLMVAISNYYMIPVTLLLGVLFVKVSEWFITITKTVKHLEGIAKSPIFSHVNSSLHGITTIRASNSEEMLKKDFDYFQDIHTSTWFVLITTMTSFGLWLDLICLAFITCTSFGFIILGQYGQVSGSLVGLAISQSLILTGMLQYGVRQSAEVVNQLTSVDRVLQYTEIEKESPLVTPEDYIPPASWPQKGFILFESVYLQYSHDKPPVLKNLNVEILAGSKIGIVGRTGAGKSSLISALFRLTEISGCIYIDGVNTKRLGVGDLRKKISIIPQEPVLFSTSLRQNLDPFHESQDVDIWKALQEVELKELIPNLDKPVARNGLNFSIGQRQLICLARAILRSNKILVMDEATANIDDETDALIQKMIRKKFKTCTVLIVAHRLLTVMDCDKIMVMENGEVVEYDHPYLLLQKTDGIFANMVLETGPETSAQLEKNAFEAYFTNEEKQSQKY